MRAMGITHRYDPAEGLVRACWDGPITAGDVREYWTARVAELEAQPGRCALVDMRTCEVRFTGSEMRELVRTILRPHFANRGHRVAILVRDPVQFGTSRQFQVFFELLGESEIFQDEAAALAWLDTGRSGA
jgi:hypothetical protein